MELEPKEIYTSHGGKRYRSVFDEDADVWRVFLADSAQQLAALQFFVDWNVVEGELDAETLHHLTPELEKFTGPLEPGHHYPQADELSKEQLEKLIEKAKQSSYQDKVQLFALLEKELNDMLKSYDGEDIKVSLSAAFTAFEHQAKHLPGQDVAEGFLHWNHLIFYRNYLKMDEPRDLKKLVEKSLHESKYWLVDTKNVGVLAKPKY